MWQDACYLCRLEVSPMPTCPKCRYYFRTLDDETNMHDCPRCGYGKPAEYDGPTCIYCSKPLPTFAHTPYCSSLCASYADRDNELD